MLYVNTTPSFAYTHVEPRNQHVSSMSSTTHDGAVAGPGLHTNSVVSTARRLGSPEHRTLQVASQDPSPSAAAAPSMVRTYGSLIAVLAVAVAIAHLAKKVANSKRSGGLQSGARSPAGILEVLGRYPLGPASTLILLKMDRRVLLLSQCGGGMLSKRSGSAGTLTTLCEITDPEAVASLVTKASDCDGTSISAKFRGVMSSFCKDSGHVDADTPVLDVPTDTQEASPVVLASTLAMTSRNMNDITGALPNSNTRGLHA